MTVRNDADLTDAEIFAAGADLEARAREIRARGDATMSDAERAELIKIIETHDAKYDNARLKLDRAHPVLLRGVAAGALDRAAGRAVSAMAGRRTAARQDAAQDANASVAEVRRTIFDQVRGGLPRRDAIEVDERELMIRRLSNSHRGDDN